MKRPGFSNWVAAPSFSFPAQCPVRRRRMACAVPNNGREYHHIAVYPAVGQKLPTRYSPVAHAPAYTKVYQ